MSYIVVEAFREYQVDVQVARPAGHQSDLVVGVEGILLVRKLLLDELVEELEVLLEGQFVEACNLQLGVPVTVLPLILVCNTEEALRVILRPLWEAVRRVDAAAFFPEGGLAIDVPDVRNRLDGLPVHVEVTPNHLRRFQDCSSSAPIMIPSHRGIGLRSMLFQLAVCMTAQRH